MSKLIGLCMSLVMLVVCADYAQAQFNRSGVVARCTLTTSFELIDGIAKDQPNVTIGIARFYNGGVVGTRGFPPGYRTGDYVWITPTNSTILFKQGDNKVKFWAKDIIELNGGEGFAGMLTVYFTNGNVEYYDVPDNNWGLFVFNNVRRIDVFSPTNAPTNIDDFTVHFTAGNLNLGDGD